MAKADIRIAMGTGTDVAIESASITLLRGDLRGIAKARRLSERTMSNIRQNLFFAFIQCIACARGRKCLVFSDRLTFKSNYCRSGYGVFFGVSHC